MSHFMPAPETLVRYEPAVEIYEDMKSYHKKSEEDSNILEDIPPRVQDILNSIIPPRDWEDNFDKLYIQYVSHQPASREDVIQLQNRLDKMLEDRQARKFGVCPIREELYSQVFDELIRQVSVDCPERGLLLMRVRDQHKMTLAAYHTIYQSSVDFGMQKQVESEEGVEGMQEEIIELMKKKQELQQKKDTLIFQKQMKEREIREKTTSVLTKREQQMKFLQMQTQNLNKFLELVKEQLK